MCPGGLRRFCLQNCSHQSTHCSCCTASASAAHLTMDHGHWESWARPPTNPNQALCPRMPQEKWTEGWGSSYLSMSLPPKQGKLFPLLKKNSTFPMAKWCIFLAVTRRCILLRFPMNSNSFESFYIKTLLKITEEMLFCIPCLHCWYYFSDSYLPR